MLTCSRKKEAPHPPSAYAGLLGSALGEPAWRVASRAE